MKHHAADLFGGKILPNANQRDVIDLQYLKHLEFIMQAKYPSDRYLKSMYSIVLCNFLNDAL